MGEVLITKFFPRVRVGYGMISAIFHVDSSSDIDLRGVEIEGVYPIRIVGVKAYKG